MYSPATATTPVFHYQEDSRARSPPPLKVLPKTPQAPERDENHDIMLPIIPDDFDDEELFRSRGVGGKRRIALPIRPKMATVPSLCHEIYFIENLPQLSQRVLMPLHASEHRRPLQLSMRRSIPYDDPVWEARILLGSP